MWCRRWLVVVGTAALSVGLIAPAAPATAVTPATAPGSASSVAAGIEPVSRAFASLGAFGDANSQFGSGGRVEALAGVRASAGGLSVDYRSGAVVTWGQNWDGRTDVPLDAQSGVSAIAAGFNQVVAAGMPGIAGRVLVAAEAGLVALGRTHERVGLQAVDRGLLLAVLDGSRFHYLGGYGSCF